MGCDNVSFGLVRLLGWWVNMRAARKKKGGRGGSERGARAGGASPSGWWRWFEAPDSQSGKSVQDGWSASRFYRSSFLYVTHCAYALISLKAQKPLGHGERTSWIDPKYHFFSAQTQLGMSQFPIKISPFCHHEHNWKLSRGLIKNIPFRLHKHSWRRTGVSVKMTSFVGTNVAADVLTCCWKYTFFWLLQSRVNIKLFHTYKSWNSITTPSTSQYESQVKQNMLHSHWQIWTFLLFCILLDCTLQLPSLICCHGGLVRSDPSTTFSDSPSALLSLRQAAAETHFAKLVNAPRLFLCCENFMYFS